MTQQTIHKSKVKIVGLSGVLVLIIVVVAFAAINASKGATVTETRTVDSSVVTGDNAGCPKGTDPLASSISGKPKIDDLMKKYRWEATIEFHGKDSYNGFTIQAEPGAKIHGAYLYFVENRTIVEVRQLIFVSSDKVSYFDPTTRMIYGHSAVIFCVG